MVNLYLNGGAAPHTVLTELDDQKLFSRGMASIKSKASYFLKAHSQDPFLRIRFLVPKLKAGVQTFRFQGSSFVVRMSEGHL